jgi:CO/xanthine dehydrogenase Mo-binding subunit
MSTAVARRPDARPDARSKAAGLARYTQDIAPPRLLHGYVVRSEHASAAVRWIDLEQARRSPGVRAVLGPEDVPDELFGIVERDERVLARERVRYFGEPLALVAADSRDAARGAASLIEIGYAPSPAVIGLEAALAKDAPEVVPGEANRQLISSFSRGDLEAAFEEAELKVETTIQTHRVHQSYIELRSALAELDEDGRLVVTVTSQAPFQIRQTLAHVFGLPMTRVVVRVPAFGGGFGGKLHNGMAPYAAALTLATRRPVQVVCDREDDMYSGNPREGSVVTVTSAVDGDGRICGRRAVLDFDSGAYTYDTPYITSMGAMQAGGAYAIDAVEAAGHAVRTNMASSGSFRSPSGPQMAFANEVHIEQIAETLGLDPIEVRRRNLMRAGSRGPTGQVIATDAAVAILARGEQILADFRGQPSATGDLPVGCGLAMTWWFTAPGASAASVRVEEDGSATVACGATEIGTGAVVSGLRELVATDLGLDRDAVRLVTASTDSAPPDFGSEGSRTLYGAGNAVLRASAEVRRILAQQLADELEADPGDVVFEAGTVAVVGSPDTAVSLAELAVRAGAASGPVVGTGRFQAPPTEYVESCAAGMLIPTFNEPTFHCHVAETAVDPELGSIKILRYAAIHDTGTVVDQAGVRGQIEGGVVQGIGYALYEEMLIDPGGKVENAGFVDYRLPTIADIPPRLEVIAVEDFPSASGPRGAKGIGEAPVILPAATIASALFDATGVRITELPLSADRVRSAIAAQRRSEERGS